MNMEMKPKIRKNLLPKQTTYRVKKKLRAAAYCRVSTESEGQETSYDTQVAVYTRRITAQPDWELVGIYADRGLSGTQAQRRPEFLRMVKDSEEGRIDLILCKSISRFSRNTLDAVTYIRKLRDLGIRLIFEKEGIDTAGEFTEMFITVLAAFAQEESRSLSENIKWGKRKRAMNGQPPLYPPYGFRKEEEEMAIVPEEAAVVRWIFDAYEHGMAIAEITGTLLANEVPAPVIREGVVGRWEDSRIWNMLNNMKYAGHILTQRRFTPDFLTGKQVKNTGQLPRYLVEDHHEGIVPQKQFDRVSRILAMKSTSREREEQYPYAGRLKCPYCGNSLRHRMPDPARHQYFFCEGEGACCGFVIPRPPVDEALTAAYNSLELKETDPEELLREKDDYPSVPSVELWWLEDFVKRLELGMPDGEAGGITLAVTWKTGERQELPLGCIMESKAYRPGYWDRPDTENKGGGSDKRLYAPYGYRSTDGETLEVMPEEAAVVRRIFGQYERGDSVNSILKGLMDDKIKPPCFEQSGSMVWEKTRISYFLQNRKYIGELTVKQRQRKWYREDPDKKGVPDEECLTGHHEGIIPREQFERCNRIFRMRLKTPYQKYPFGDLLHCPFCGHVLTAHKMGQFHNDRHFCCEGDGACRKFVIRVLPVEAAVLSAWNSIDLEAVRAAAQGEDAELAARAKRLLEVKREHPSFKKIDYWWLDELAEEISFGKHSWTPTMLKKLDEAEQKAVDDRILRIDWRCGVSTTVSTGLKSDWQEPVSRAARWDEYLLRNPDKYPELTEEVRQQRNE